MFIILNDFGKNEDYFIIKGSEILNNVKIFFGSTHDSENPTNWSAVNYEPLKKYKDNWVEFDK